MNASYLSGDIGDEAIRDSVSPLASILCAGWLRKSSAVDSNGSV